MDLIIHIGKTKKGYLMARGRMLRRSIATDAKFNKLSIVEQWIFMRMIPFADDHGRLPGDVIELRLLCIPGSTINNADLEDGLTKLDAMEIIYFDKGKVIQFCNFDKHQKFNHAKAFSIYPTPRQHIREKTREPSKIGKPEKIYKTNLSNIRITFDDFWDAGFKKSDRKKCQLKWLDISDESKKVLMRFAKRYLRGKKGLASPYTFLALKKWEKSVIVSRDPKDFTELSSGFYRAYCSRCGKEVYSTEEQLVSTSLCCDAILTPEMPFVKLPSPKFIQ